MAQAEAENQLGTGDAPRIRRLGHQRVDSVALALEFIEHFAVELPRPRKFNPHGIDVMAVDDDFVMKMRTGRETTGAEIADNLALRDPDALVDAASKARHVVIGRHIAIGVLDLDASAIARHQSRLDDQSIAGGENRCADRRRPIDAVVRARIMQDRMETHAEAGTKLARGNGFAQQELAGRMTRGVEIVDALIVGESETGNI